MDGHVAGELKACLPRIRKGVRQAGDALGNEFGQRKLVGLEGALLDVAVTHILIALEHAQVDGELGLSNVHRAIGVQSECAGDGRRAAHGVVGEADAGELFLYAIGSSRAISDIETNGAWGWRRRRRLPRTLVLARKRELLLPIRGRPRRPSRPRVSDLPRCPATIRLRFIFPPFEPRAGLKGSRPLTRDVGQQNAGSTILRRRTRRKNSASAPDHPQVNLSSGAIRPPHTINERN